MPSPSDEVELDLRENMKPGAKYYELEALGVPVRLEIGPRDIAAGQAMLARRTGGKGPTPLAGIVAAVTKALDEIQQGLYAAAKDRREKASVLSLKTSARRGSSSPAGTMVPLPVSGSVPRTGGRSMGLGR